MPQLTHLLQSQHYASKAADLVDGEADGVHVLPVAAVVATVFLHQSNQEAACGLVILGIVVLLQEADLILRVNPEGVCREAATVKASWDHHQFFYQVHLCVLRQADLFKSPWCQFGAPGGTL